MDNVLLGGPFSRSSSDVPASESAEKIGNIENFAMFQHCPSICTVCHFFNDSEAIARSYSYVNLTAPEKNSEVCQKLTRLPYYLQSDWAEKESSMMSKPPSAEIYSKASLNSDRAIRPPAHRSDTNLGSHLNLDINPDIKRDTNLDKIPINDTVVHLPAYAQKQIAAPALTERNLTRNLTQQIHALSDQIADIKYRHHQEIDALKAQIASIGTRHQEELLNRQQRYEVELRLAYQQRYQPAITGPALPRAVPEPSVQPTTYQVPRDRTVSSKLVSSKLSPFFGAAPFFLSMMGLGITLIFSVVLAYPSEALLNSFVSLMSGVVPVLFLLGIFSLVITAILELNR